MKQTQTRNIENVRKSAQHMNTDEKAVSPVIGVILMVAITVIMAAVVGAFVFGIGGDISVKHTVTCTATQTGADTVDVTFQGGPDADMVTNISVSIGADDYECAAIGSSTASDNIGSSYSTFTNPEVGDMVTCHEIDHTIDSITTGSDHIIITAEFTDGSKQIIMDGYV